MRLSPLKKALETTDVDRSFDQMRATPPLRELPLIVLSEVRRAWRKSSSRRQRAAARREFDVVMAWSVDRLGRSLQDLVALLGELHALGVDLFLHQQGLDTTTPGGKAMFQMMGVFAEFERAMIQERVRAGLRRAKDEGKQLLPM